MYYNHHDYLHRALIYITPRRDVRETHDKHVQSVQAEKLREKKNIRLVVVFITFDAIFSQTRSLPYNIPWTHFNKVYTKWQLKCPYFVLFSLGWILGVWWGAQWQAWCKLLCGQGVVKDGWIVFSWFVLFLIYNCWFWFWRGILCTSLY